MATKKTSSNIKSLTKQLSQVATTAKAAGIDTRRAESMLAQTRAEGSKPYKGSKFEADYEREIAREKAPIEKVSEKPITGEDYLSQAGYANFDEQELAGAQQAIKTAQPTQQVTPAPGGAPSTQPIQTPTAAPTPVQNKYRTGFEQVMSTGQEAPAMGGEAIVAKNIPAPTPTSVADTLYQEDEVFSQIESELQDYFSPKKQRESLVKEYQKMVKASGIQSIDTELIDMKNVIEGTEDDIRNEVTKAGGFATDSQVLALTNSRNKVLIKNYNTLLETRNAKQQYLDKMMDLSVQDRKAADDDFDRKMNFAFKVQEYRDRMQNNAKDSYQKIVDKVGYAGLSKMTGGDPYYTSLIEKSLGLGAGGLAQLATVVDKDERIKDLQIQKLENEIADSGGGKYDPSEILAYAQQYASTGQIPSGIPKGSFGVLSQVAKELPKPNGSLVDRNTGIKSSTLSPTQEDAIIALRDVPQKLDELKRLRMEYGKAVPGSESLINMKIRYETLRDEARELLLRARTGAAITEYEESQYNKKIPGVSGFLGVKTFGNTALDTLKSSLEGKLKTQLDTLGLSIYGYSKVDLGGTEYVVGQIIQDKDSGKTGRVNADGSITLLD